MATLPELIGLLGSGLSKLSNTVKSGTRAPANNVVPADPTTLSSSIITPVRGTTTPVSNSLRAWAGNQGFGGVSWDPSKGVTIAGKTFDTGKVPGTTYDANTNTHLVTDSQALTEALGYPITPTQLIQMIFSNVAGAQTVSPEDLAARAKDIAGDIPEQEPVPTLDTFITRATAQLEPTYQHTVKNVLGKLATDQQGRGFYGQLPSDVITQDAVAEVEAAKNADIVTLANKMWESAQGLATAKFNSAMQAYSTRLQAAMDAVQQSRQADTDRLKNLLGFADFLSGNLAADRDYGLEQDKLNVTKDASAIEQALARTDTFGEVLSQDAELLGLEAGTPSQRAKEFWASLSARGSGSGKGSTDEETDEEDEDLALMEIEQAVSLGKLTPAQAADQLNILTHYGKVNPQKAYTSYNRVMGVGQGSTAGSTGYSLKFPMVASRSPYSANQVLDFLRNNWSTPVRSLGK